jgi:hypothetical protein
MAIEQIYNVAINLTGKELRNAILQNLSASPTAAAGGFFYNTSLNGGQVYNGTSWRPMDAALLTDGSIGNSALTNPNVTLGSTTVALGGTATTLTGFTSITSTVFVGALNGNANTATTAGSAATLSTTRTIGVSGITGTAQNFNGSANVTIPITAVPASLITGTLTSSFISNFNAAVQSNPISSLGAAAANISMAGYLINNLGPGVAGTDAVNVNQLNTAIQGASAGISAKQSVVAVATSNVTVLSGTAVVVDGITLSTVGERVLLTNQTTASQNGPWVVQTGAWTRPTTDSNNELETGAFWFVEQGTSNAASQWWLNSPAVGTTITPGTTAIGIVKFGAGASYTASATGGLTLTGSVFSILLPAGSGLVADATGLHVDTTIVARKYSALLATSATSYTVTHNLGTKNVQICVMNTTTGDIENVYMSVPTTNTVTIGFGTAPAANLYQVTVIG